VDENLDRLRPEEVLSVDLLETGMEVFVRSIGYDAVITAIDRRHGRLRVRAGRVEMEIHLSDASPRKGKTARPRGSTHKGEPDEPLDRELKVIGLRVDEALPEIERYLNRISLEGGGTVRIIHGRGTGALMRGVREYLQGHPLVAEYRKGEQHEGGDGATVVAVR
jgi:DNA mismatch repair protein MutS2